MELKSGLSLAEICRELGLDPQFLVDLAQNAPAYYSTFDRRKRSGGVRPIAASQGSLKRTQRLILDGLLAKLSMPAHVHGCVKGRSAVTNAEKHVNQEVVINMDLSSFFGSISLPRVKQLLLRLLDCDDNAAQMLAQLLTFNNQLPQGAPTSPALANLEALPMDDQIMQICREGVGENQFAYSRYVDDITMSGASALVELIPKIKTAIEGCGFNVNGNKTRILRQSTRQSVTGVVVNKKLNVPKKLIRRLKQHLYYCQKYGLKAHAEWRGMGPHSMLRQLKGQIGYLNMTQPDLARTLNYDLEQFVPQTKPSREELRLRLLKHMIEEDLVAKFSYENTARRAAPAEVFVDAKGKLCVRAFQLAPLQGWHTFKLSTIRRLKVHRLS